MSVEQLIKQTIEHGSIFEAVEFNIFGYQEFIDYVAKFASEIPIEKLRQCYCALMVYYPPIYHYSYGKHLLTYLPKDDFILRSYCILGGSPELPLNKDEPSNTLWSYVFDFYTEVLNDTWSEEIEKTMLLCNKVTSKLSKKELIFKEDPSFIQNLFAYRCDKILAILPLLGIPYKTTCENFIHTDWFDQYPSLLKCFRPYIERCNYVRIHAPLYFAKMCDTFQGQLGQLTLNDFEKLDLDLLKITCQCFPTQFTSLDIDEKFTKITIYPLTVRAYILGFPCFPKIPQKEEIDQALEKLSKLGVDEYVRQVLPQQVMDQEMIANTEDTLFEDPNLYSPLDRIDILENGKIYRFTRPEFAKLHQDKTNFWTKIKLSYADIYTISLRLKICKELNLPYSDTLPALIEKACKGILYQNTATSPQGQQMQQGHGQAQGQVHGGNLSPIQTQHLIQLFQNMLHLSPQTDNLEEGEIVISDNEE